jgi:O-succinylhomoserine sulfhydrylase
MRAHSEHALLLAQRLETHPKVLKVYYPGLASHPQHTLADRQQHGFGGIVTFEVRGGREAAWRMIDSVHLFSITANLGDTKSTITHPATTTHQRLTPEERTQTGITEGLIRLSVGLEEVQDLWRDLERALAVI